jgi:DNA repair protein RadA/Sms
MFICANCGNEFSKWQGQCSFCKEWNSLKEITKNKFQSTKKRKSSKLNQQTKKEIINLGNLPAGGLKNDYSTEIISTGIKEFDRVLGKGIVQGSAVLFAGEPGIGKSTLLTQLIGKIGGIYVAGEESADQIGLRVKRLGLDPKKFDILGTNSIEEIEENLERVKDLFKIAVVDSIQVVMSENLSTGAGSVAQIKESAFRLVNLAKRTGMAIFVVGHVTKEGDIAGPKLLEHMVDTVLYFEGEKTTDLRILRTTKNRFGPIDEVGIFKMAEKGLIEIRNSQLVENIDSKRIGSAITVVVEGARPMLVEIQALVVESFAPMPKRVFSGIDFSRGQLLIAVAQKSLGLSLYKYDVYLSVTGGIKINDTGVDLAVMAAIYSSYKNKDLGNYAYVGEVSLLGQVKKVKNWEKRIKEVVNLGKKVKEIKDIKELKW